VLAISRLHLRAGERLAVLGSNGAGKTTVLRLMAGLEAPTIGRVEVDGAAIAATDLDLRRRVGYATQRPGLLSTSVIRNVELPLRWRGVDGPTRRRLALGALERLNVEGLADRKAVSLSGGEAQRVSLARALALDPALLLLDEPAAGLDAEARRAFFDDLERALSDRATTVVHVSHRAEEALRLADRIAVLSDGTVRQIGAPATVVQEPVDATVARVVGYENVLDVHVDASGQILIDGTSTGATATTGAGPAILAAWARAVHLTRSGAAPLQATVERVTQGPGRWDLVLTGPATVHAHLSLGETPPQAGERVGVRIDTAHAAVIVRESGAPQPGEPHPCGC
jgi:ABC-type sulfate/molybdate transport systems ATPase subunit